MEAPEKDANFMNKIYSKLTALVFMFLFAYTGIANASLIKGIYITQTTLEDSTYLNYLIQRAKKVGIHTFIVDMDKPSKRYEKNIGLLAQNNINYVARIVVFPGGGTPQQIKSQQYLEKKLRLVKAAVGYGASQIQLDYIRYSSKQPPSAQNAQDILKIIQWFKARTGVPLQIDVFGISSFGPSKYIGQDIKLFANSIDVLCPMVYPSHYEPFRVHAVTPYETVHKSLTAIRKQFNGSPPFKLYPYIELSNYRYPLSKEKKLAYIYAQIKAAENANADGWYVWSPHNYYDNLFKVLETRDVR